MSFLGSWLGISQTRELPKSIWTEQPRSCSKAPTRRKRMLISFSTLILSSQLIVAVADKVPDFNIEHECKVDSASAFDPNVGLEATIKRCQADEQEAKDELQKSWSESTPADKKLCVSLAT